MPISSLRTVSSFVGSTAKAGPAIKSDAKTASTAIKRVHLSGQAAYRKSAVSKVLKTDTAGSCKDLRQPAATQLKNNGVESSSPLAGMANASASHATESLSHSASHAPSLSRDYASNQLGWGGFLTLCGISAGLVYSCDDAGTALQEDSGAHKANTPPKSSGVAGDAKRPLMRRATAQRLNVSDKAAPKLLGVGQESQVYRLQRYGASDAVAAKVSKESNEASQLNTLNEYLMRLTIIELYSLRQACVQPVHGVLNNAVPIVPPLAVAQSFHSFAETSALTDADKNLVDSPKMVFTMPLMDESLADCVPPESENYFDHLLSVSKTKRALERFGVIVRDLHDENILLKDNRAYIGDCGQFRLRPGSEADAVYSRLLTDLDLSAFNFDKTDRELKQLLKAQIIADGLA